MTFQGSEKRSQARETVAKQLGAHRLDNGETLSHMRQSFAGGRAALTLARTFSPLGKYPVSIFDLHEIGFAAAAQNLLARSIA